MQIEKFLINNFLFFSVSWAHFSKKNNYIAAIPYTLAEVLISTDLYKTTLLLRPNKLFFLISCFGDKHCLIYKKSNSFAYIFIADCHFSQITVRI